MTLRSSDVAIRSPRDPASAAGDSAPDVSAAARRVRLAHLADALAHLDRLGVDVVLDGPGDRFRYVVEGRALSARGIVALALRRGLAA